MSCDRQYRIAEAFEGIEGQLGVKAIGRPDCSQDYAWTKSPQANHPQLGRTVWLHARVERQDHPSRAGVGDQRVYWYAVAASHNAVLEGDLRAHFSDCDFDDDDDDDDDDDGLRWGAVTDIDGWCEIAFEVSEHSGDHFEVYATLDPGYTNGVLAGTFTAWAPEVVVVGFEEIDPPTQELRAVRYPLREAEGRPHFRRQIRVRARLGWRDPSRGDSLEHQRVYLYCRYSNEDRGPKQLPAAPPDQPAGYGDGAPRVEVQTDAEGWTPVVDFRLPTEHGAAVELFATELAEYLGGWSLHSGLRIDDSPTPTVEVVRVTGADGRDDPHAGPTLATKQVPGSKRRQYVNIDEAPHGEPERFEHGRSIRVVVHVDATQPGADLAAAVAGQLVYVYQAAPNPKLGVHATFASEHGERVGLGHRVRIASDGSTEPIEILLPDGHPGETFTFFATTDGERNGTGGVEIGQFECWRRLWYRVNRMRKPNRRFGGQGDLPSLGLDDLPDLFSSAFIELIKEPYDGQLDHVPRLMSGDCKAYGDQCIGDSFRPYKINVIGVDDYWGRDIREFTFTARSETFTTLRNDTFKYDANDLVHEAKYANDGAWHDLPHDRVTLATPDAPKTKIRVDLRGLGVQVGRFSGVDVRLRLCVYRDDIRGNSNARPHVYVKLDGLRREREKTEVIAHEIGHQLGLVRQGAARRDLVHTMGGHCTTSDHCIMWWITTPDHDSEFCDDCREDLVRRTSFAQLKADFG